MARYQHTYADGDPAQVPIRDAATVMIVRDHKTSNAERLEVLMVQRASRAAFGASAWVFPGGRVDSGDSVGEDTSSSGAVVDVEVSGGKGGTAWRNAAVRETLEEAGVLLTSGGSEAKSSLLAELRHSLLHEAADLSTLLEKHAIELDLSQLHEVGRFITPMGPPRRFDTWFYLAEAPPEQTISPDGSEVVNAQWVSPVAAIELWQSDKFPLMSVTHRMLACLRRYDSVAGVLAHAASQPELRRVRVNDPDGVYEVLLPEDPGYSTADLEVEHGWVRL